MIRAHPIYGVHGGQKALAPLLRYSSPTINAATLHPESQMSREFIRRLAAALPEAFGWAAERLKALDYPDATGPAPGADRARDAGLVDEAIGQVEAALEKLRAARRRM